MEILTGNAKEDFGKWLEIQEVAPYRVMFDTIPDFIQIAYIVEWLDAERILYEVQYERNTNQFFGCVIDFKKGVRSDVTGNFHNRKDCHRESIIKANEIYNLR